MEKDLESPPTRRAAECRTWSNRTRGEPSQQRKTAAVNSVSYKYVDEGESRLVFNPFSVEFYFSKFFSRQRFYDDAMNILGITLQSFWILWSPPKKIFGRKNFLGGGWGKKILWCFTGKSLCAQFNFSRQTTVEKFPASITNYMNLFWLGDWKPLGMGCCGNV